MTELIRTWIIGLTAAAFLTSLAMTLTPKGRVRTVVQLVTGLVTIAVLVSPVLDLEFAGELGSAIALEVSLDARMEELTREQESLTSLIISERSGTYILDKAESLGLVSMTVQVETISIDAGQFFPYEVWLTGDYSAEQRHLLSEFVAETFGIPAERQHWRELYEDG